MLAEDNEFMVVLNLDKTKAGKKRQSGAATSSKLCVFMLLQELYGSLFVQVNWINFGFVCVLLKMKVQKKQDNIKSNCSF